MSNAHRRVSLYGASLCIPDDWNDFTDYVFELDGTPIESLMFGVEALPVEHIEAWLEYKRQVFLGLGDGVQTSPVQRYQHPGAKVWGFQTRFDPGASSSAYLDLVVLARPRDALRVRCRAQDGYQADFAAIIASIEPEARPGRLPPNRYRVHGASFASPFDVTTPRVFSFETPDESKEGRRRLVARWEHLVGASTPAASRPPATGGSTRPAAGSTAPATGGSTGPAVGGFTAPAPFDWRTEFNLFEPRELHADPVEQHTHDLDGLKVHESFHHAEVDDVIGEEREHHSLSLGRATLVNGDRELTLQYNARSGKDHARHEWRCLVKSLQSE